MNTQVHSSPSAQGTGPEHDAPPTEALSTPAPATAANAVIDFIRPRSAPEVVQRIMLAVLVGAVVILSILNPVFRSPENLLNILQQASLVGVIALGMQLMIVSGGFDLSVGAVAAASGCAAAAISLQAGVVPGIIAGLVIGVVVGAVNGVLIAKIGINPFVATFGTQAVVMGLTWAATDARPLTMLPAGWIDLGLFSIGGVAFPSLVFVAGIIVLLFVMRKTLFGQHIYAVGSNKEGSRRAGIKVNRVLIAVYTIGGLCAGIAGLLLVTISGIGNPTAGQQWALMSIAAVIIGGTPLTGGVGGISSSVIGVLALTVLTNALNLYSVSAYWQPAIMGFAVLAAVSFESWRRIRNRK
ncbi:ABC transporter permease [Leucobacter musarum]|uniref:ABC transporter permease n=1 Tax=Leucobacter musarum TaxID=1930747 RepID=UPI0006A78D97|nr:ABC transporter permease [Leucobacter musarum]